MNFLVDAQPPRRLVWRLREAGHDAIHTLDLPESNRSTDSEINAVSLREERIVATKDVDFVSSFLLTRQPHKFWLYPPATLRMLTSQPYSSAPFQQSSKPFRRITMLNSLVPPLSFICDGIRTDRTEYALHRSFPGCDGAMLSTLQRASTPRTIAPDEGIGRTVVRR
ncbi:DUF5615 family PIN-like protein [Roseiflexus castenholzii]|uniref:DUF5615 family PIN-like protein n=1 Tax=Roseiflexus castenholzii TaxID=120962 RepID=UPI003C7E3AC6